MNVGFKRQLNPTDLRRLMPLLAAAALAFATSLARDYFLIKNYPLSAQAEFYLFFNWIHMLAFVPSNYITSLPLQGASRRQIGFFWIIFVPITCALAIYLPAQHQLLAAIAIVLLCLHSFSIREYIVHSRYFLTRISQPILTSGFCILLISHLNHLETTYVICISLVVLGFLTHTFGAYGTFFSAAGSGTKHTTSWPSALRSAIHSLTLSNIGFLFLYSWQLLYLSNAEQLSQLDVIALRISGYAFTLGVLPATVFASRQRRFSGLNFMTAMTILASSISALLIFASLDGLLIIAVHTFTSIALVYVGRMAIVNQANSND